MKFTRTYQICSPARFFQSTLTCLFIVLCANAQAGFLDDLSKGIKDTKKAIKDVEDVIEQKKKPSKQPAPAPSNQASKKSNQQAGQSKTEKEIVAKGKGMTFSGQLTNIIGIDWVGRSLNYQFGSNLESRGVTITLNKAKSIGAAGGICNTFLNERFGKENASSLVSLRDKYAGVRGKKVVLENVRRSERGLFCVFSKLHVVDEPGAIPAGSEVSGVLSASSYGLTNKRIYEKMKLKQGVIPVAVIILRNAKSNSFDSGKCKQYYSAIVEEKVTGVPDEFERLKPNMHVTLKDVGMLDERGVCTFDHYKSFNMAKSGEVIAKAEAAAKSAGTFSFKYHLPQITAAMEKRPRDKIIASVKRLKKYGYGVSTHKAKDHVTAIGQSHPTQLQIRFDRKAQANYITSTTLIQKSMTGCDTLTKTYANKLMSQFGLKAASKTKKGQVEKFVKGGTSGVITYGRSECSVHFTAELSGGAAKVSSNNTTYSVDNKYKGFNFGNLQLCADADKTIKALKAEGYNNIGFGKKIPKSGMLMGKNKRTAQYKYNLQSVQWDKGKITRFTISIDGEGSYKNHFESERRRIEKASGKKFKCKKDKRNHQCLYRDRKTYTNVALNATPRNENRFAINAQSGCK